MLHHLFLSQQHPVSLMMLLWLFHQHLKSVLLLRYFVPVFYFDWTPFLQLDLIVTLLSFPWERRLIIVLEWRKQTSMLFPCLLVAQ